MDNKHFNLDVYKKYNHDLKHMTDNELIKHWENFGRTESRICNVPEEITNFSFKIYKKVNDDLKFLTEFEYVKHFISNGFAEKRVYSINSFILLYDVNINKKIYENELYKNLSVEDVCLLIYDDLFCVKNIDEQICENKSLKNSKNSEKIVNTQLVNVQTIDEQQDIQQNVQHIIKQHIIEQHIIDKIFNKSSDTFSKYVDKIFIINLKTRQDRYNNMVAELIKQQITNVEFFNAICPMLNDVNINHDNVLKDYSNASYDLVEYGWQSKNEYKYIQSIVGCKVSHVEIIKLAKERKYKSVLILEDDIEFVDEWLTTIDGTFNDIKKLDETKELNKNFDMLYLTCNHHFPYIDIAENLAKPTYGLQTCGYIINESIYDFVIDNAVNSGMTIDIFYCEYIQKNPYFKVYCVMPNIINQVSGFSTIEDKNINYIDIATNRTIKKKDIIIDLSDVNNSDVEEVCSMIEYIKIHIVNCNKIYVVGSKYKIFKNISKNDVIFLNNEYYEYYKNNNSKGNSNSNGNDDINNNKYVLLNTKNINKKIIV